LRAAPAVVLLALAASGCGGAAWHAGPVGHIEAGVGLAQGGPEQLVFDGAGNLYGVDCQDSSIFRIDTQGQLWIVGGTGNQGFSGNGGVAARADFTCPVGITLDAAGNVYVSDHDNRIRRIDPRGIVHPFAGAGSIPPLYSNEGAFGGDGGPARRARFRAPAGLAVDAHGNLFLADRGNGAVRRIDRAHTVTTVARVAQPDGLAFDATGALYIAEPASNRVQRLDRHGALTTFATIAHPAGLAFDAHGNLYIAEPDENVVRRVDPHGRITTVAGTGRPGFSGDGGPAPKARLNRPSAVAVDARGNLYIGDHDNGSIRKVDRNGTITTFFNGRELS
jgi:sugar lactone lactonase YvrE